MITLNLVLLIPLAGIITLALLGHQRHAGNINIVITVLTFITTLKLGWDVLQQGVQLSSHKLFYVDSLNISIIILTTFISMNTAIFSKQYMQYEVEQQRITPKRMRLYHAMYQCFIFALLLALMSNNLGLLWVAMEAATLATVLLVSLYRTPESIEAAWKYFILCGVGIAQALFGTVLLYFAAEQALLEHQEALLWSVLYQHAGQLEPTVMSIAFVFLLVGYGTKAGLVPLHNWLPDTYSEGPTPMPMLSGLLLNVALYALVRIKILVDNSLHTHLAGHLMMGFGLLSFLVAVLFLYRQRDIKRLFGYSSIEHMGLMTFAFGLSTPLSTFSALLHMIVHALTKSAIFINIGHILRITNTQAIDKIRGLIRLQPMVGWGLLMGTVAIAGFPPFGIFMSEFLLLIATMKTWPWLTLPLLIGFGIGFAGLFRHLQAMVYGEMIEGQTAVAVNMLPVIVQLLLVLWLGLAIPMVLTQWLDSATQLIAGAPLTY